MDLEAELDLMLESLGGDFLVESALDQASTLTLGDLVKLGADQSGVTLRIIFETYRDRLRS